MLRFLTAGESHGPAVTAIIEGLPAGITLDMDRINALMRRRQVGYGRGGRMEIEKDRIEITGGVRHGKTLGSPISVTIENRDWENWSEEMQVKASDDDEEEDWVSDRAVRVPRPGHADLAGGLKYRHRDLRNVLERASARETAARVAIAGICQCLLQSVDIKVAGMVTRIGTVAWEPPEQWSDEYIASANESDVSCPDTDVAEQMRQAIDSAKGAGDSIGGTFQIRAMGVMPGLGSHVQWDRRLDGRLAAAMMAIPAIKGVQIGAGFDAAQQRGSQLHDPIVKTEDKWTFKRLSNNAGGIEGGISNGESIIIDAAMKPIPTLQKPLPSVNLDGLSPTEAHAERSDACAVPAAGVVGEAVVSLELARAILEKFGGDHIDDIMEAVEAYQESVGRIWDREDTD